MGDAWARRAAQSSLRRVLVCARLCPPYGLAQGAPSQSPPAVQRIPPVLEPGEAALFVEPAEFAQDLAAVAGAECGHQLEIGRRAPRQRGFERLALALRQPRRLRHRELGAVAFAERLGAVEAGLGAGAAPLQRRIERDAAEARRHHEIAVGLEAR